MVTSQQIESDLTELLKTATPLQSVDISVPKSKDATDALDAILDQRKNQRDSVLEFVTSLTRAAFLLLGGLLTVQSASRIVLNQNFSLLNGHELEVLSVSVFGQTLGVVWLITRSLWDDKHYLSKFPKYRK